MTTITTQERLSREFYSNARPLSIGRVGDFGLIAVIDGGSIIPMIVNTFDGERNYPVWNSFSAQFDPDFWNISESAQSATATQLAVLWCKFLHMNKPDLAREAPRD